MDYIFYYFLLKCPFYTILVRKEWLNMEKMYLKAIGEFMKKVPTATCALKDR